MGNQSDGKKSEKKTSMKWSGNMSYWISTQQLCTKNFTHQSSDQRRDLLGLFWRLETCGLRVFIWGEKPKLQKNAFLIGKMGKCLGWRPLADSCLNPPVGALEKGDVSNKYSLYTIPMVPPIFCMTFGKTLFSATYLCYKKINVLKQRNYCFVIQVVFLHKKKRSEFAHFPNFY